MNNVKRITQAYSQTPWRKQLQWVAVSMLVLVFVAIIAGVYLEVTARAVTLGQEIQSMQYDINTAERENEALRAQLAELRSSAKMLERAQALGFKPVASDQLTYFEVDGYFPGDVISFAAPPEPLVVNVSALSPAFNESLLDWFRLNVIDPARIMAEVKP